MVKGKNGKIIGRRLCLRSGKVDSGAAPYGHVARGAVGQAQRARQTAHHVATGEEAGAITDTANGAHTLRKQSGIFAFQFTSNEDEKSSNFAMKENCD